MNKVFLNGELCDSLNAKVSVFDRGFLFGDALYEVIPVYDSQAFFVDKHLTRLNNNLEAIGIKSPSFNWIEIFEELIKENGGGDLQIYIQISRGSQGKRSYDIPKDITPTTVAFTMHNPFPKQMEKEKGLRVKLVEDVRWLRCDIKSNSLLGNVLLNDEAVSSGYQTALLMRNNLIHEGSSTNFFIVTQNNIIQTPPLNNLCLPGVTRAITIELIKQLNWSFKEEQITVEQLLNAKEIWITSTTKEIYPVSLIENSEVPIGPFWRTIEKSYQELVR